MSESTLPIHPITGLQAIGYRRHGVPIWPVMGASDDDAGAAGDGGAGDAGAAGDGAAGAAGGGDGDGDGDGGKQAADSAAEIAKWKALARKHENQAKANADAAQRLQAMEDAGKSETEKLQALLDAESKKAHKATVRALKLQVAADKGLPPQLAKFLPDLDDEVDMLAAADDLLEASGSTGKGGQPTRQPKSKLTNPLGDNAPATREALVNSMLGKAAT